MMRIDTDGTAYLLTEDVSLTHHYVQELRL